MIHGKPGTSSYFQGKFKQYGKHQWNVKLPYNTPEFEVEALRAETVNDPYFLRDLGLDPKKVWLDGRSGGWLVVDQELTVEQIREISTIVEQVKAEAFKKFA